MSLPNPGMDFSAFATLTAVELDNLVENIEALAAGTGLNDGVVTAAKLASGVPYSKFYNSVKFSAYKSGGAQAYGGGAATKITFGNELYDTGSNFNTTLSRFVAPTTAYYDLLAAAQAIQTAVDLNISFYKNGVALRKGGNIGGSNYPQPAVAMKNVPLTAGDYIEVYLVNAAGGGGTIDTPAGSTYFEGSLSTLT